eukprot:6200082-Pleurochrysis_carterae.AAC.2
MKHPARARDRRLSVVCVLGVALAAASSPTMPRRGQTVAAVAAVGIMHSARTGYSSDRAAMIALAMLATEQR